MIEVVDNLRRVQNTIKGLTQSTTKEKSMSRRS